MPSAPNYGQIVAPDPTVSAFALSKREEAGPWMLVNFPSENPPSYGCWEGERRRWIVHPIADQELIKRRNHAIVACCMAVGSAFAGLALVAVRRSIVTLLMNFLLATFSTVGLYGAVHVRLWWILMQCIMTPAVVTIFLAMVVLTAYVFESGDPSARTWMLMHAFFLFDYVFVFVNLRLYWHILRRRREARALATSLENQEFLAFEENFEVASPHKAELTQTPLHVWCVRV